MKVGAYRFDRQFLYSIPYCMDLRQFFCETPELKEKYGDILKFNDNVKNIKEKAFKYNKYYDKVYIPSTVTSIAEDAFEDQEDRFTILGSKGSEAEKFANAHGMKFEVYEDFKMNIDNYNLLNDEYYFKNGYKILSLKKCFDNNLLEYLKGREDEEWHGACAGTCYTNHLFYKGQFNYRFWQLPGVECYRAYSLENPRKNMNLNSAITFYQTMQSPIEDSYTEKLNNFDETSIEGFYKAVENYYKTPENENDLLYCAFAVENEEGKKIGAHAVLITGGPEPTAHKGYGGMLEGLEYKIPIYDSNSNEMEYIYFSPDFKRIAIGFEEGRFNGYMYWGLDKPYLLNVSCQYINAYKINTEKMVNLERCIKENTKVHFEKNCIWVENKDSAVIVKDESSKLVKVKDGEKIEGDLEGNVYLPAYDATGTTTMRSDIVTTNREYYSVEPENGKDSLDVQALLKDSFMAAKTEDGGKVEFYNKKYIKLSNPSGKKYELTFTVNEDYMKLPWYTIKLSGENAKDIKVELTEEGYVVTGDSLKNIKIVASNTEEKAELTLNTDAKKVLLKASKDNKELVVAENEKLTDVKDAKLDVYEDKDNDGSFETKTQTATPTEIKNEVNINNENKSVTVNTGDSVGLYIVIFIISIVLIGIITYFKHKK